MTARSGGGGEQGAEISDRSERLRQLEDVDQRDRHQRADRDHTGDRVVDDMPDALMSVGDLHAAESPSVRCRRQSGSTIRRVGLSIGPAA
jgi:hypothetical protein